MASKRRLRRKAENSSCRGKIVYNSVEEASKACRILSKKYDARLNYYQCKFCKKRHIGNTPKKVALYADIRRIEKEKYKSGD